MWAAYRKRGTTHGNVAYAQTSGNERQVEHCECVKVRVCVCVRE